jgi:hypothetical protein
LTECGKSYLNGENLATDDSSEDSRRTEHEQRYTLHIKKICAKMIMKMVPRDRNQENKAFAENFSKTVEITHSFKDKWRLQYDTGIRCHYEFIPPKQTRNSSLEMFMAVH